MPERNAIDDQAVPEPKGLWSVPAVVLGTMFVAAIFQSVSEPDTTVYHIGGVLLGLAIAPSLYVVYLWARYVHTASVYFWGLLSLSCIALAYGSF